MKKSINYYIIYYIYSEWLVTNYILKIVYPRFLDKNSAKFFTEISDLLFCLKASRGNVGVPV